MLNILTSVERALRINADASPQSLLRIRSVWMIGVTFILTQLVNMGVMAANYGYWTLDHSITAVGCSIVVLLIVSVRWCKNVSFYAIAYSVLLLSAIIGSALPDHSGINSSLVPFIALGPMLAGFMAGRRSAIFFFAAATVVLGLLYSISITHSPLMIAGGYVRETNRLAQGFFALSLSTVISVFVSDRIYMLLQDLHRAADRARRAEALKSDFLATVSHELRTPLNGVIGLADALRHNDLGAPASQLADTIFRSGEGLLRILNDLLDLSKIEAGKLTIEPRQTNARDLIQSIVATWQEAASAKDVSLCANIERDVPDVIIVDDLRVTQIVQNLVSNAIKFTETGSVAVGLTSQQMSDGRHQLEFRVRDSGGGVPPEMLRRIFERYDQGAAGTARRFGGTGLGLPICRDLAELMGGSVRLEETGPQGSTFLLELFTEPVDQFSGADTEQPELEAGAHCSNCGLPSARHQNQKVLQR